MQMPSKLLKTDFFSALQKMPLNMFTPNLHRACCRLYAQEEQRGAVAKDLELFIERDVQRVKENLKYRISARPEALFVHDKLADEALAAHKSQGIRQFDAICPDYRYALCAAACIGYAIAEWQSIVGSMLSQPARLLCPRTALSGGSAVWL